MKSLPRMGPETSPMTKFHSAVKTEESAARMETLRQRSPPVAMAVPVMDSSCGRGGPEGISSFFIISFFIRLFFIRSFFIIQSL